MQATEVAVAKRPLIHKRQTTIRTAHLDPQYSIQYLRQNHVNCHELEGVEFPQDMVIGKIEIGLFDFTPVIEYFDITDAQRLMREEGFQEASPSHLLLFAAMELERARNGQLMIASAMKFTRGDVPAFLCVGGSLARFAGADAKFKSKVFKVLGISRK